MKVYTPDLDVATLPSSVVVSISGARDSELITIMFNPKDGGGYDRVALRRADTEGNVEATSVPLAYEDMDAGTYWLQVLDGHGAVVVTRQITVAKDSPATPRTSPKDANPVLIPASVEGPIRKWVLQDLMPGGLGSWVMPNNPSFMTSPHQGDEVSVGHTTASGGLPVIWQAGDRPKQISFGGYTGKHSVISQFIGYTLLRRRFWLIDHRGRGWIVAFTGFVHTPRRDWYGPGWMHDYEVTALVYNPTAAKAVN